MNRNSLTSRLRHLARRLPLPVRQRLRRVLYLVPTAARRLRGTPVGGALVRVVRFVERSPKALPYGRLAATLPRRLSTSEPWYRLDVTPATRLLLTITTAEELAADARAGVVRYRYLDHWGRVLHGADHGKDDGRPHGAHDWIPRVPRDRRNRYIVLVPERAAHVDICVQATGDAPVTVTGIEIEPLGPRTIVTPFTPPADVAPRSDLRIALIADTFTVTALSREAHVHTVAGDDWAAGLDAFGADLLFIESAWNGNDGAWLYRIANLKDDDRRLRDLVDHAHSRNIPVLFWNKEDPAHYDDFIAAAALADVVATTDASIIDRYRSDLGHDRIIAVPFCIQSDIHNPMQVDDASSVRHPAAVFLGSWWAEKYGERRAAQEAMFEGSSDFGLEIYDRYLTWDSHERYRFAPEWLPYVHGSLSYDQALNAYRRYQVVLNVNTVTDSPTMFSRRALEAAASGALIVTNRAAGTTAAFGDELIDSVDDADGCRTALAAIAKDPDAAMLRSHLAYRHVHRQHSWANRLDVIANACNLTLPTAGKPKISAVLATKRRPGADRIIRYLASLDTSEIDIEPIVVAAFDPDELEAVEEIERSGAIILREQPGETLGDCLNRGAAVATGGFIAKVDDDDIYGPNYFADLLLALEYSRADIAGKQTHYQHFEINDSTVVRYPGREHRFTHFVCGSTLLCRSAVYDHIQFPSERVGEDSEFLRRARDADLRVFSADRFNYVSMRRADLESHTWQEDHDALLTSSASELWGSGLPTAHIDA